MTREEAINVGKKLSKGKGMVHSIYQDHAGEFHVFCLRDVVAWVEVGGLVKMAEHTYEDPYKEPKFGQPFFPAPGTIAEEIS